MRRRLSRCRDYQHREAATMQGWRVAPMRRKLGLSDSAERWCARTQHREAATMQGRREAPMRRKLGLLNSAERWCARGRCGDKE
jgi:hypothetical protein